MVKKVETQVEEAPEAKLLKIENAILYTEKRMGKNMDKVEDLRDQIAADGATLQLLYDEREKLTY